MAPLRIAYLGIKGLPARAGADRVVEAIVIRLSSRGVKPVVYCDASFTPPGFSMDGIELVRLPSIPGKYFRAPAQLIMAAVHAVLFGHFDVVHLHHIESSFVLPLLRLRFPVVSTSHGFAYWRAKWGPLAKRIIRLMDGPFMRWSSAVSCVSEKDSRELYIRYGRMVEYIPNGVGLEVQPDGVQATAILAEHGLRFGEYFIFVAGRIEPTKGAHLAIQAVNCLRDEIPFLLVGDDRQVPAYSQELREMAGPAVRFQSLVEDPAVLFGLMRGAKCLVFPSLMEAMSMVLLEAASLGIPVVCSDIPENRQVMCDQAVYFEPGDVPSLARQLDWVLHHTEEAAVIASKARERVHAEYSWDSIAVRYALLYWDTCGSK